MSNNTFIDLTEETVNKGWELEWEFSNEAIDLYKYNGCTTIAKCEAIDDYKNDLNDNGEWFYHLGSLTIGSTSLNEMFENCTDLTSFDGDLSRLENGIEMFQGCTGLTTFSSNLSRLKSGTDMFNGCYSLTSFNVNLPRMTGGTGMFNGCTALTSFNGDLTKLAGGENMFNGCTALTTFRGDLSSLENGQGMFNGCTALTTFRGDLSSLENGRNMFSNCPLSEESIMNIADTIGESEGGFLSLGYDTSITDTTNIMNCCDRIVDKGWKLYLNGTSYKKTTE